MTWWRGESHYEVFFNRDELKTRSRAFPPEPRFSGGVRFLAPTDPDAGGAWMMVNERGLTVCLLNLWHESTAGGGIRGGGKSRGQLVLSLADLATAEEVMAGLKQVDCSDYKPFTLVVIDRTTERTAVWNGGELKEIAAIQPLTSSSYCFHEVKEARFAKYNKMLDLKPESLRNYQGGEEKPSAFTVRMNRPDAQTWSRSWVCVFIERITWEYLEEMRDLAGESITHKVDLDIVL